MTTPPIPLEPKILRFIYQKDLIRARKQVTLETMEDGYHRGVARLD